MKLIEDQSMMLRLMAAYVAGGYEIQPVNMFAVRNSNKLEDGIWNDRLGYWDEKGHILIARGTTDPSPYYIHYHPMNRAGTAMMVSGYQKNIWVEDRHGKSQYTALCNRRWKRCGKQKVVRLDKNYQPVKNKSGGVRIFEGYFCCNFHRGDKFKPLPKIGPYSGGCQVIQDPHDFAAIMVDVIGKQKFYSYYMFEHWESVIEELLEVEL